MPVVFFGKFVILIIMKTEAKSEKTALTAAYYRLIPISILLVSLFFAPEISIAADDYPGSYYMPGDVNGDGRVLISDITAMSNLFRGKVFPPDSLPYQQAWIYPAADINGDCRNIGSDITYMVKVFQGMAQVKHCLDLPPRQVIDIRDDNIQSGDSVYWNSDIVYILHGPVFVEKGATLVIEAGTLVKAAPGIGDEASCLVICRGAKIIAEGGVTRPIVFTSISDYTDIEGDLTETDTGLWGGIYILGNAPAKSSNAIDLNITDNRHSFGGENTLDNSGILKYISVRYGGVRCIMGETGLFLGGVGNNTIVKNIEIYASAGHAFTFEGGSVKAQRLLAFHTGRGDFTRSSDYNADKDQWLSYNSLVIKELPRWLTKWSYLSKKIALLEN